MDKFDIRALLAVACFSGYKLNEILSKAISIGIAGSAIDENSYVAKAVKNNILAGNINSNEGRLSISNTGLNILASEQNVVERIKIFWGRKGIGDKLKRTHDVSPSPIKSLNGGPFWGASEPFPGCNSPIEVLRNLKIMCEQSAALKPIAGEIIRLANESDSGKTGGEKDEPPKLKKESAPVQ